MKHTKTIVVIAFLSLLSFAQARAANNDSITPLPVELKYAGDFKNQPMLQLNITGSAEENEFIISITDEAGLELYSGNIKGEKISKQFLLNQDLGDAVLNFKITGRKSGRSVAYKISKQLKVTEQMDVVKL